MASTAKILMDIYYAEERALLSRGDVEAAEAYSRAEAVVNNLMHGMADAAWIRRFVDIMRDFAEEAENEEIRDHFHLIAELAENELTSKLR